MLGKPSRVAARGAPAGAVVHGAAPGRAGSRVACPARSPRAQPFGSHCLGELGTALERYMHAYAVIMRCMVLSQVGSSRRWHTFPRFYVSHDNCRACIPQTAPSGPWLAPAAGLKGLCAWAAWWAGRARCCGPRAAPMPLCGRIGPGGAARLGLPRHAAPPVRLCTRCRCMPTCTSSFAEQLEWRVHRLALPQQS